MKKILYIFKTVLLILGAAMFAVSCSEETIQTEIILSEAGFSLLPSGEEIKEIKVTTDLEWKASTESKWLTLEQTETTLSVSATKNEERSDRLAQILVSTSAGSEIIYVVQMSGSNEFGMGSTNAHFSFGAISPKGTYLVGCELNLSSNRYDIIQVNTKTNLVKVLYTLPQDDAYYFVAAADDFGNVFMSDELGWFGYYVTAEGKRREYILPDNFVGGSVNEVSQDGYTWVGAGSIDGGGVVALKWVNGEPTVLELPELMKIGEIVHNITMWDALGCSADGSIVYGRSLIDQTALYWDADNTPHYVAQDLVVLQAHDEDLPSWGAFGKEGPKFFKDHDRVSGNGRYISCNKSNQPGITGSIVFDTVSGFSREINGLTACVLNDGTVISTPINYYPSTVYKTDGTTISGDQFVLESIGLEGFYGKGIRYVIESEDSIDGFIFMTGDDKAYVYDYIVRR